MLRERSTEPRRTRTSLVAWWFLSTADVFYLRFSFVCQFTEEKLGQAEKTELDPHLENLISRADSTKNWTEKILRQTEVLLQPNPSRWTPEIRSEWISVISHT